MISNRKKAGIVGILIIAAYGVLVSLFTESLPIIVLLEAMSGMAVISIALLLYPIIRPFNKGLTIGYLITKSIEGGAMIIAGFLILSEDPAILEIRNLININHVFIFIPASMFLYLLLYKSKLVPGFISLWGMIALVSLLIGNILELAGNTHPMVKLFYPLIMLNEIFLAIWLMAKGFNLSVLKGEANEKQ